MCDTDGYGAVRLAASANKLINVKVTEMTLEEITCEIGPLPDASVVMRMAMVLCGLLRPLIKLKHMRDWTAAYCVCCDADGYGAVLPLRPLNKLIIIPSRTISLRTEKTWTKSGATFSMKSSGLHPRTPRCNHGCSFEHQGLPRAHDVFFSRRFTCPPRA